MPTAYVLVLCDYSFPDHCVKEVDRVNGPYDIVMKLFHDNMNIIKESIGKYMTRICGIQSTLTLMAE